MSKVIMDISFTPYKCPRNKGAAEHAAERAFYNGTAEYNYFSYTEKYGKVVKDEENGIKNYMEKTSGVFNAKGVLTAKEKADLSKKLKETKSIIWHGFISFDEETSPLFNTQEACVHFVNRTINSYFERNGLDKYNLEFFCSLHSDTDHRHIHFAFFEKEPKLIDKKTGKLVYRSKGKMGKKVYKLDGEYVSKDTEGAKAEWEDFGRQNFIANANLYLEENKYELELARKATVDIIDASRTDVLTSWKYKELRSSLIDLWRKLPAKGRKSYNSANLAPYRKDVDKIVKQYIDAVPGLRQQHNALVREVFRRESDLTRICKNEGFDYNKAAKPGVEAMKKDIRVRLGNRILKIAESVNDDYKKIGIARANDLTRKIAAKNNRKAVERSLIRSAKYMSHNGTNYTVDYSVRLHQIEEGIENERQRKTMLYGA